MRVDIAARLPPGIAIEPVLDNLDIAHQRIVAEHLLNKIVVDAEEIEKLRQVGRVPFAVQIGLGYSDVAAIQESRRKAVAVELHRRRRAGLEAAEPYRAAIGKRHVERAALQSRTETKRQPNHSGEVRKNFIHGIGGNRYQCRH